MYSLIRIIHTYKVVENTLKSLLDLFTDMGYSPYFSIHLFFFSSNQLETIIKINEKY